MWYNIIHAVTATILALIAWGVNNDRLKMGECLKCIISLVIMWMAGTFMFLFWMSTHGSGSHFFVNEPVKWVTLWPDLLLTAIWLIQAWIAMMTFVTSPLRQTVEAAATERLDEAPSNWWFFMLVPALFILLFIACGYIPGLQDSKLLSILVSLPLSFFLPVAIARIRLRGYGLKTSQAWTYSLFSVAATPIMATYFILGIICLISAFWRWFIWVIGIIIVIAIIGGVFSKKIAKLLKKGKEEDDTTKSLTTDEVKQIESVPDAETIGTSTDTAEEVQDATLEVVEPAGEINN